MARITYCGDFNWHGETKRYYCRANNDRHAFTVMCTFLAREMKRTGWEVRNYFWDTNKYRVWRTTTTKEDDSGR